MSLSEERAIVKQNKKLKKQLEQAQDKEAFLRLEMLERATAFVDQTEVIFALVDFIFSSDEVRTLGEAQRKWQLFKTTVDESESAQAALDALDIDITINHMQNQQTVMNWWSQDRQKLKTA